VPLKVVAVGGAVVGAGVGAALAGGGVAQVAEEMGWGAALQLCISGPATWALTAKASPFAWSVPRSTSPTTRPSFVISGPALLP